ncbi:MAG: hypothetical protein LBK99_15735 [Opitutaceae bacterium]|jgi:hypothetical protein|nr:hypothetical protein [Opitutaceae bacterium]
MNLLKSTLALAASCSSLATLANAALAITDDDITNNAYTFSISFDDLINNAKFSNALYSSSNIFGANTEGTGDSERRYVTPNQGQTSASFVIAFDFSQAGYEITGFSIKDSLYINNTTSSASIAGESGWTTDLADPGTRIRVINSTGTPQSSSSSKDYSLTQASSIVYYTVAFTATNTTFAAKNVQWSRSAPGGIPFEITFALAPAQVPEPATTAILAGVSVLLLVFGIRWLKQTVNQINSGRPIP